MSYTITADVWSVGYTILEAAQARYPLPNARAGLIDLLTHVVRQPVPKLEDELDLEVRWSDTFKYFIECWSVALFGITPPSIFDNSY